ncbi:MAG: Re/Si-specific NAD(P)(+) transhydrogenase subunit alpha [Candidatus Izemoplasmataceae bacterium]
MKIGVIKETSKDESRVALIPNHVSDLIKKGHEVEIEKNAGFNAGYLDEAYSSKGAKIYSSLEEVIQQSDLILSVRNANASDDGKRIASLLKPGQIVIGLLEPYQKDESFDVYLDKNITAFSMELIPRTTRAQSMDVLSSMANLAGYKAVLIGASESAKMFPMMMTAAGTIVPAKVFVLGVGVAGLQAIATAKRLGAVVSAYDVRSEVKEQVLSLGAKFVEFDLESAEGEGGYAKAMDEAYYERQRMMMQEVLKEMDVVITTANIPGKKAPILLTQAMVESMSTGSVIVDLAAERGGNCALTKLGQTVIHKGVKIVGVNNVPSTLSFNASALYSKNIVTFIDNLLDKETSQIRIEDDIVKDTLVTYQGQIYQDRVKSWMGVK